MHSFTPTATQYIVLRSLYNKNEGAFCSLSSVFLHVDITEEAAPKFWKKHYSQVFSSFSQQFTEEILSLCAHIHSQEMAFFPVVM